MWKRRRRPAGSPSGLPPVDLRLSFADQIAQLQQHIDKRKATPMPSPKPKPKVKVKNQSPPKVVPEVKIIRLNLEQRKLAIYAWLYLKVDPLIKHELLVCVLSQSIPEVSELALRLQLTEKQIVKAVDVLRRLKA